MIWCVLPIALVVVISLLWLWYEVRHAAPAPDEAVVDTLTTLAAARVSRAQACESLIEQAGGR